jgi:predicted NAD/FAD-binding protein
VRKTASDLLHTVADGGEISITQVRNFAEAVLASEPYLAAKALLDGSPEFAVRRALELAALVLTADEQISPAHQAQDGRTQ